MESKLMVLLAQELKWNILWKYFQLILGLLLKLQTNIIY